ncbi:DUF1467 domain-containing protein [Halostagnicola kamekurae]|uniref:Uncharacterized protein n=1 Tax=Halostagnicola kamekurae TaxID=619731 RepID=A0A1I6P3T2_9EURY|nr:DUF1467 domain-containing protein [Halostagnicola kamekurae]SFS34852.1 hypothetical protein SAMN04488556_0303 [Halostagnicola kamekurae]
MRPTIPARSTLSLAVSAGVVALGVAVNDGFAPSLRTVLALAITAVGLFGIGIVVRDRSLESLRLAAGQFWAGAFVAFLPYGLATSPNSEAAAALGDAFAGPLAFVALEAVAGAGVLCATLVTVLYAFASYGIYPGRPTPEERVLERQRNE